MRITVVQETDWLQRGPHQQHHLFERLSLRGHKITVLDYPILRPHWPHESLIVPRRVQANAARIYEGADIHLIAPGTSGLKLLARPTSVISHGLTLAQLLRTDRPDIIVSYALSTGLPALYLARRFGIPLVFHVIDALHTIVPSRMLQPAAHLVEQWLFRKADEVLLINEHLRDYAIRMGAQPDHARVLRTGVDLARFGQERDVASIRDELGIHPEDFVLFFMGWIYGFSGVREAAQTLQHAPSHVKMLVAGDGDDYETLCTLRDKKLGNRLILTGRVPYGRIPDLLSAADVCLLPFQPVPATEHIVPIKLYEYMAGGKPVIATPLPGVRRDVGENHGVVYAPAEKQIETALALSGQIAELGQQARSFVEGYCDWESITEEFEALLLQCVGGGR